MTITADLPLSELAAVVAEGLRAHGIDAVLTGGGAVSVYTDNKYVSRDLDFITPAATGRIDAAMRAMGFDRKGGRHYDHPNSQFGVEFPTPPLAVGNRLIHTWDEKTLGHGTVRLLRPTESVMDRLVAYYHWKDTQALEQAVAVAERQHVDLEEIRTWSHDEGMDDKFEVFRKRLTKK